MCNYVTVISCTLVTNLFGESAFHSGSQTCHRYINLETGVWGGEGRGGEGRGGEGRAGEGDCHLKERFAYPDESKPKLGLSKPDINPCLYTTGCFVNILNSQIRQTFSFDRVSD